MHIVDYCIVDGSHPKKRNGKIESACVSLRMSFARSRRRTDHANWRAQSSQKRGSYFGAVSAKVVSGAQRKSPGRPDRRRRRKSNRILERRAEGAVHQKVKDENEKQRLATVIQKDEENLDHLETVKKSLTVKIRRKDDSVRETEKQKAEAERELEKYQLFLESIVKDNERLSKKQAELQESVRKSDAECEVEANRFPELVRVFERVEGRLERELKEAKTLFHRRMERLQMNVDELRGRLSAEETGITQQRLERLKSEHGAVGESIYELKEALMEAKAYKLHKALRSAMKANHEHEHKLRGIIAHLQSRLHTLNERRDVLTAETNVMSEEVQKLDAARTKLCERRAQAAADVVMNDGASSSKAEASNGADQIQRLRSKLNIARMHTKRLMGHLSSSSASHCASESATRDELEHERRRLLVYAQSLERTLSVN